MLIKKIKAYDIYSAGRRYLAERTSNKADTRGGGFIKRINGEIKQKLTVL